MAIGIGSPVAKLTVAIGVDNRSLKSGLAEAKAETKSSGLQMGSYAKLAGKAMVAGFAGVAVVATAVAVKSVEAASKYQDSLDSLNQSLKNSGIHSKGAQSELVNFANAQSKFGVNTIDATGALAKFVTSSGSAKAATKDLTAAENIAAGQHISLAQATSMVLRMQTGSTRALTAAGINYTKVTPAVTALTAKYKAMGLTTASMTAAQLKHYQAQLADAKASDKATNATRIATLVNKKYAGDAAAQSKTMSGEWKVIQADLTNLEVQIGMKLLPVIQSVLGWIIKFSKSKEFKQWMTEAGNAARAAGALIKQAWDSLSQSIARNKQSIMGTLHALESAFHALYPIVKQVFHMAVTEVKDELRILGDIIRLAMDIIQGHWGKAWGEVKNLLADTMHFIQHLLGNAIGILGSIAGGIGRAIFQGIVHGLGSIDNWVGNKIDNIGSAIRGAIGGIKSAAESLGSGIVSGIVSGLGSLASAVRSAIEHAISGVGFSVAGHHFSIGSVASFFASGGVVPGTGNTDSVPAMLTPGEVVLTKKAVAAMGGAQAANSLNFASGGVVPGLQNVITNDWQHGYYEQELMDATRLMKIRQREVNKLNHEIAKRQKHHQGVARLKRQRRRDQVKLTAISNTVHSLPGFISERLSLATTLGSDVAFSGMQSSSGDVGTMGGSGATVNIYTNIPPENLFAQLQRAKIATSAVFGA